MEGYAESALDPPAYGVHLADVEVDVETGSVDILNYIAAQDIGFAINPKMVEGQLEGGVAQSIEFELLSEIVLDRGASEREPGRVPRDLTDGDAGPDRV